VSLSDKFNELENEAEIEATERQQATPKGWESGVVWDGSSGEITTGSIESPPDSWDDLLRQRGLDPDRYEVVGDSIKWCSFDGWRRDNPEDRAYSVQCYSYKAEIRLRTGKSDDPSYEELYKESRKAKAPKTKKHEGDSTLIIALSDFQIGNSDGGGIEEQIAALAALPDLILDREAELRKSGTEIGQICVAGLGDLVENTCDFYATQSFSVEADRRQQVRVVRRSLRDILKACSGRVEKVIATAVPGNHGENRKNGKAYTRVSDNDDVAVFEQVAEILHEGPYDNVGFKLPGEAIAMSVQLSGQTVSFTHGHTAKSKGLPINTMWEWWKSQTLGRAYPFVADSSVLITGHYHHLNLKEQEGRVLFICPSLTNVGEYWANTNGVNTSPGVLTITVNPDGWNNLKVLK